ncbi:MAG: hypothetical protein ACPGSD_00115 [Flavobacteriales bacterium]
MKKYIVDTSEILTAHVDLNEDFHYYRIEPFIKRVERNLICKYISRAQYKAFLQTDISDVDVLEVIDHLEAAISNLALMNAMVHLQNAVGNVGADEENKREWWRDRDLLRSYRTMGMESLDMALNIMAERIDLFPFYRNSEPFTKTQKLIINSPQGFNEYIDISESRLTFEALIPLMKFIQISEFTDIDKAIFLNPTSAIQRDAVFYLKAIIAHRTKAQAIVSNKFSFDGFGFSYKVELLPWELKLKLDKDILERQIKNELDMASTYRDQMWEIMNAHKSEFNIPEEKEVNFITKNQSSFGLI